MAKSLFGGRGEGAGFEEERRGVIFEMGVDVKVDAIKGEVAEGTESQV